MMTIDDKICELELTTRMPFDIADGQVIYVEPYYDVAVNAWIRGHLGRLSAKFDEKQLELFYIPAMLDKFVSGEVLDYYAPYGEVNWDKAMRSSFIVPYLWRDGLAGPSLLFEEWDYFEDHYVLKVLPLPRDASGLEDAFDLLVSHLSIMRPSSLGIDMYCVTPDAEDVDVPEEDKGGPFRGKGDDVMYCATELIGDPNYADNHFDDEMCEMMQDVRDKIERLRQHGIAEEVLQSLLLPRTVLSRMDIDAAGRIVLPGYGGREVRMTPLVKAVYLLFLRHPEGIVFKDLPDYRDELTNIYCRLTRRTSVEDVRRSIIDVTDPMSNSINEKCSRIREAFLREFDDRLASYYYVTGGRFCPKGIKLPRHLVSWEWMPEWSVRQEPIRLRIKDNEL